MDRDREYRIALELASTWRCEEAKQILERILEELPDDVEALILLGKVEYYLRHRRSSRARFETALLCEPENVTATFGLQFYKEISRNRVFAVSLVSTVVLLIAMGVLIFFGLDASFRRRLSELEKDLFVREETVYHGQEALSQRIAGLESLAEESIFARLEAEGRITGGIEDLTQRMEQHIDFLEAMGRETQSDIDLLAEIFGWQIERQEQLRSLLEDLNRKIERLQAQLLP